MVVTAVNLQIVYLKSKLMQTLLQLLASLTDKLRTLVVQKNAPTIAGNKLFEIAKSSLGQELTPKDEVPDSVACMSTMNALHKKAFGEPIGGDASTYLGYLALRDSKKWVKVSSPLQGDVCISPSGFNDAEGKKVVPNGHIGCYMGNNQIASNSSTTGLFSMNYSLFDWRYRFVQLGHYPLWFFRKVL